MQSIRSRLSLAYTIALAATIVVFGAALVLERQTSARREREEQLLARLAFEADFGTRILLDQFRGGQRLTVRVPTLGVIRDTTVFLSREVGNYFEGLRDIFVIADEQGRVLYQSEAARALDPSANTLLRQLLIRRPAESRTGEARLLPEGEPHRWLVRPVPGIGAEGTSAEPWTLVVAARADGPLEGPRQLILSMLLVAPVIIGAASVFGYWLAGRALRPVDAMIRELAEVQDGRSLHRRLAVPPGGDELTRLGMTLNNMLTRIERSFGALRRFTADASHELKTPLMVLRAGVERSLTHPGTPPEVVSTLDETLRQINEMNDLVSTLLTLARADEGRADLVLVETDLRGLLAEAAETAEILGEDAGVMTRLEQPDTPLVLPVDPGRIRQLLMNLVTNAVKYTPAGGEVDLVLEATEQGGARIIVRDTGIGIAPGDLPNIFERFWRADIARTRTGERPGVGLGLAICKWIVEAHGGAIEVQSRPGRGSAFVATLPAPKAGPADTRA
ncbi:MAG TPA: ATP-binding protein [Gemmatimonadales bacterium]|nr:ATP-binding protein [Gemmatimonadales bacterium]